MSTQLDYGLIQVALSGRLAAIPDIATIRPANFDPGARTIGQPYIEEDFVPATGTNLSVTGPRPNIVATGLYAIRYFGIEGRDVGANLAAATAIVSQFSGWKTTLTNGDVLRISTKLLPTPGQSRPNGDGWFYTPIAVYWSVESQLTLS